jgi:1-acyl-sn-glycerol-3-phosphate acyltransferase
MLGFGYAVGYWLHRHYFRVVSSGHDHLPKRGAAVVVGNHSGVLPFDAVMLGTDIFRYTDPPRLLRYMVDYFVYQVPFLGTFFRQLGQMPGTRRNFDGLVSEGHLVGIFPEGAEALGKPVERRYELYPFSHGHVELAARHGVPVVPFGLVGAEEQMTMVADLKPLARALRLPYFPVTTTFPWFGPLGLLPRPVRYFIHYGDPIEIDPAVLRTIEAREAEVARVRDAVDDLIHEGLKTRQAYEEGKT